MTGLVHLALRQRALVVLAFVLLLTCGLVAFRTLNIEAYPDPTPPMIDVITQANGLSGEEIERYVTVPIEVITSGLPNLKQVRSVSLYGLSDVKLQFGFEFADTLLGFLHFAVRAHHAVARGQRFVLRKARLAQHVIQ